MERDSIAIGTSWLELARDAHGIRVVRRQSPLSTSRAVRWWPPNAPRWVVREPTPP